MPIHYRSVRLLSYKVDIRFWYKMAQKCAAWHWWTFNGFLCTTYTYSAVCARMCCVQNRFSAVADGRLGQHQHCCQ